MAICTFAAYDTSSDPQLAYFVETSLANKRGYAAAHGYHLHAETDPRVHGDRAPTWGKIRIIRALLEQGFEWVLWVDMDAFFMNWRVRVVEDVVAASGPLADRDVFIAKDHFGYNAGVWLFRNTAFSRQLLDTLWADGGPNSGGWFEQSEFHTWCRKHPDLEQQHIAALPQKALNAYPDYSCRAGQCYAWQPGDFIYHMPGGKPHDWRSALRPVLANVDRGENSK